MASPWLVPSLGECPVSLSFIFVFRESSSVISCLGRLLYEIGVALRSITPFVESFVSVSSGVVYEGILIRSLLVSLLHLVFSSSSRHYELILVRSCDLISGMAL